MTQSQNSPESHFSTLETKVEQLGSEISELLKDTRAKQLRIEEIENLAADIDDRLLTMADNIEILKDIFENMDKKLDILATILMPED